MADGIVPAFDLTGRVALVTGASSGFGARFARLLAAAGAKVVLAARRIDRLDALREEIGRDRAVAMAVNVADEASVIAAYDAAEAVFGTVDTIVANAGTENEMRAVDLPIEAFDGTIAVNLRGVFLTAREGARRLLSDPDPSRGRVVLISSITATKSLPGTAAYSASKAGVLHLGKVLAREWARPGIAVNTILPGYIATELTQTLVESTAGQRMIAGFPRRRLGELRDLDAPLLFFCSDLARGVTGAALTVDDGQSL